MPVIEITGLADQAQDTDEGGFLRPFAAIGARGLQSALGVPSDIANFLYSAGKFGIEKTTGTQLPEEITVPREVGQTPADVVRDQLLSQFTGQKVERPEQVPLPTTQKLEEKVSRPSVEAAFGEGAFDPQSGTEEFVGNVVEDLGAFLSPFSPFKGIPFKQSLAMAGFGNLASTLSDSAGIGQEGQIAAKIGTVLLTSFLAENPFMMNRARGLFSTARESVPESALAPARQIRQGVNEFERSLRHRNFPLKDQVIRSADVIQDSITEANTVQIHKLMDFAEDINDNFRKIGKSPGTSGVRRAFGKLSQIVDKALDVAGKDSPNFNLNAYRQGKDLYRALHTQNILSSLFKKIPFKNPFVAMALGGAGVGGAYAAYKNPTAAGLGIGTAGLLNFMNLLRISPSARSIYKDIIKSVSTKSAPALIKQARRLDEIATKKQPNNQQITILEVPGTP